jgi:hypothetical protein
MAETNSQVPKSEPLIDSESGSFFLKHQKLLVYVEKVTEEQILKLLEYAVKNMAKRLKLDKDSVSNHPVIQPVEKTNIYLVTGLNLHLINPDDIPNPVGSASPKPAPQPVNILNNRITVIGNSVFSGFDIIKTQFDLFNKNLIK